MNRLKRRINSPQHVEDFSVGVNPNQNIGNGDELELCMLSVWKINLWFPNRFYEIWVVQIQGLCDVLVFEPLVLPFLAQVQVHLVILESNRNQLFQRR